jgi:putative DNA primase/helicase
MSPQTIQDRLTGIIRGMKRTTEDASIEVEFQFTDNLKILRVTQQDIGIDLSDEEEQAKLEPYLSNIDLVVVDNLSTLTRVKENDADSWLDMQKWLIKLRQKNTSVLLIRHAGKGGSQRGTSRKEDILDTVIALKRPKDYETEQGAKFEVTFEKSRGFTGDKAKPLEAAS